MAGKLTTKFVREVTVPGRYSDGSTGLMLFTSVGKRGAVRKSFVQRLTVRGRRVDRGLGSPRWMTLTAARELAAANWLEARRGGDPFAEGDEARRERAAALPVRPGRRSRAPTLAALSAKVIPTVCSGLRGEDKVRQVWESAFQRYVYPELGDKPIDAIDSGDVLAVLLPLWASRRPTAKLLRARMSRIFRWAQVAGYRADDPAATTVLAVLPKAGATTKHQRAIPHRDVPGALARIQGAGGPAGPRRALSFLILTAGRSGEVRGATWGEIDFEAAVWTVPGERMKGKSEHRVPLSGAALALLRAARAHSDGAPGALVFPSARGRLLDAGQLSRLCGELGLAGSPHGFRTSFRTWAGDMGHPRELAETALAHVVGSAVEAAYARTDLLERRRVMMAAWAEYLIFR